MRFITRVVFVGVLWAKSFTCATGASDDKSLVDAEQPLAARQEKARYLLHAWGTATAETPALFAVNDNERLGKLQHALDYLSEKEVRTDDRVTSVQERLLTRAAFRWATVDDLSFKDDNIRHFFSINPARYPCEPRATVWEIVIPLDYFSGLDDPRAKEIANRLKTEQFGRVSYDVSGRFGKPGSGFKGEVTRSEVGSKVFGFYEAAWKSDGTAGPYKGDSGYYFVKVDHLLGSDADCFEFYRERAKVDYGRLWLKKLWEDSLTTAMLELKPELREVGSSSTVSDVAFIIDGQPYTLMEAKAMLPYLSGNPNHPGYWKSIQKQALELEVIYRSRLGKDARESRLYKKLHASLVNLRGAAKAVETELNEDISTETLRAWFDGNRERFTRIGEVSYELYHCDGTSATVDCTRWLENFREKAKSGKPAVEKGIRYTNKSAVDWESLPREFQVAMQDLGEGEWSEIFSWENRPAVVLVVQKNESILDFDKDREEIKRAYLFGYREKRWKELLGVKN